MLLKETHGKIWHDGKLWCIEAEPHVMMRMKRVFGKLSATASGMVNLPDTSEIARDLQWFCERYPMENQSMEYMNSRSNEHRDRFTKLRQILSGDYRPASFDLAIPAREYQRRACEMYLSTGHLLLLDQVGLGKTCSAICLFTKPEAMPACVVCPPHIQNQWVDQIAKFAPNLRVHIIKRCAPYEWPKFMGMGPDVLIITYSKLSSWADAISRYCKSVVFDEMHDLRHSDSIKYVAAQQICNASDFRMGLTATPVYNYGGEIFNLLNLLSRGCLGEQREFYTEWCTGDYTKARIKEPKAFGSWAREQGLILRRTRKDVGRELPDVVKIPHVVDSDAKVFEQASVGAMALAQTIMSGEYKERTEALETAGQFDMIMRQATGMAKAPFVASFVDMLIDSGSGPVVLCGWHRAVYDIWSDLLKRRRIVWYTGTESAAKKNASKQAMIDGDADVMIMSLRSGLGMDGIQETCRTIVFGELDWSPGVYEQCIGRVDRDGQTSEVMAYFLISETGSDPIIADINGIKLQQASGIVNPDGEIFEKADVRPENRIKQLAESYLEKHNKRSLVEA